MPAPISEQYVPIDLESPGKGVEPAPIKDSWDDKFTQPYTAGNSIAEAISDLSEEEEFQAPAPAAVTPTPTPAAVSPQNEPEPEDVPEVKTFADGSSVTIEKTNKGWKGTLDNNDGGGKEVFYGKTKNELLVNSLAAKAQATKKIRTQEKELKRFKLQNEPVTPAAPAPEARPSTITADDVFKIKTQMEANPVDAVEEVIKKRTGMGLEELARTANEGREAKRILGQEGVAKDFMSLNPDYWPDENYENYRNMVIYLGKHKLHKNVPDTQASIKSASDEMYDRGLWTVSSLQEAFDYLKSEDLLIMAPELPEEETPVQEPAPAPVVAAAPAQPPANSRIVRTGPRAGLGIRSSGASAPPPAPVSTKPPTVEELENMTDDEIARLMAATRQYAINTRRK